MNDVLRCTKSNKLNLKFIVMGCTKSNKAPKVGEKKERFRRIGRFVEARCQLEKQCKKQQKNLHWLRYLSNSSNGILSYLAVHTSYYRIVMLSI